MLKSQSSNSASGLVTAFFIFACQIPPKFSNVGLIFHHLFLNQTAAKEPTKIKVTSDKKQYEGGKLSIELTDLNKTPLSKQIVNITITNKKGKVVVDDVVKTNSKGKAKLDLNLKKGKYKVNVSYGGNENYTGDNTTQKLTIKEKKVVEATVENVNSNDNSAGQASDSKMPEETRKIYEQGKKPQMMEYQWLNTYILRN